jgi:hypothetical protein
MTKERYVNSMATYTAKAEHDKERYIDSMAAYTTRRGEELHHQELRGRTIATATKEQSLYRLVATVQVHDKAHLTKVSWHSGIIDWNISGLTTSSSWQPRGLDLDEESNMGLCNGCIHGKQHRLPFPTENAKRATDVLELVHTDICGPMKQVSLGGAKYFLTFIDDKTRNTFVYFLSPRTKS